LAYLAQINPEWADVADMADAGAFISALKKDLLAEVKGSGEVVHFPSLAAVEIGEENGEQKETGAEGNDAGEEASPPAK
jgi:hypothetical protein